MNKSKVMLFAYDGSGLGHLMRLVKIASGLSKDVQILVVSGHNALSEVVHGNMGYYKLPNFYDERDKGKDDVVVNALRMKELWDIINKFKPDAFITDYLPLGKRCELLPIVTRYKTKKYFILRSEIGGDFLMHNDVFSKRNLLFLERNYDKIYVASDRIIQDESIYDWLPQSIQQKMVFSGCVTYKVTKEEVYNTRKKFETLNKKWVVCSVGGGKKGCEYIKECITIASKVDNKDYVFDIVLGYYSPISLLSFGELIRDNSNLRIHKSIKNLYLLNASADVVICSGAYNSLLESMQGKIKTIIAMSVMNDEKENEQTNNIIRLSEYYDIRRINDIKELESVLNDATKFEPIVKTNGLNINGIEYISKDIERQL